MRYPLPFLASVFLISSVAPAMAQDKTSFTVNLKDHQFSPAEIKVPADKPFILLVKNLDATPEEIESHDLKIEKVVAGKSESKLHVRALEAGTYGFVGEYHEDSAKGTIVAQ